MRSVWLLTITALGVLHAATRAEDWPEFRGPTGQGIVRQGSLPVTWSTTENVVWKQALPGLGWSSPVVVDGRIYLTTSVPTGADQSLRALCLDAANGKTLWDQEAFHVEAAKTKPMHSKNSHASPTPIVSGDRVFAHFGHQGTACFDRAGKVIWRNTTLRYNPVHGCGGSPILVDDALVYNIDGTDLHCIVALDQATGKILWKTDRTVPSTKAFSFATPLLITVKGKQQIISPASDAVYAYEPRTGKEIWRVRYADGYSVIPRPVFGHGLVFICTGYNAPKLLAIRPDGEGDVTDTHIAWSTNKAAPHTPSLVLSGDELYMISDKGVASCLDARTGKQHWQERIPGGYSASPLLADGRVYFQSEEGAGTVVKASTTFAQLARNAMGERTLASYAVVDEALFLRTEKHLYRIQEKK